MTTEGAVVMQVSRTCSSAGLLVVAAGFDGGGAEDVV